MQRQLFVYVLKGSPSAQQQLAFAHQLIFTLTALVRMYALVATAAARHVATQRCMLQRSIIVLQRSAAEVRIRLSSSLPHLHRDWAHPCHLSLHRDVCQRALDAAWPPRAHRWRP